MSTAEASGFVLAKDRVFNSCGYEPHDGQWKIHDSLARHRVADFGRRAGKSRAGGMELIPEALATYASLEYLRATGDRKWFWLVGPNYDDDEKEFRVFYDMCRRLGLPMDRPGTYNSPESGLMQVSLWDGMFMLECRSATHPESLDGEGLHGVVMVEAAKMKPSVWNKFIRPALADKRGWSLHTSTPEGKNHFYELWQKGQNPEEPAWESWKLPSWVNTHVFPGGRQDPEILELERDMSPERFNQEIGAEFTDYVGRVFKAFDEEVHVRNLEFDPKLPIYGACDYGWTNPFVWLMIQVDVWDNVKVLREYRVTQRDINDIGEDLSRIAWARAATKFYPDPASPGDSAVLSSKLKVPFDGATGGPLKERLEAIRQALKVGPEHAKPEEQAPKLLIDRSCVGLIQEMNDYRYPDSKEESLRAEPEEPLDKDNHGPEALGRFYRGYFGPPQKRNNGQRAKVRKSNLRRAS